jgi:VWFA-related protein
MNAGRSLVALAAAALLLGAVSRAQQSASQAIFRAGTDYVRVDVVVTDKDDKPIVDLKKEDFEILEKDRPQTIEDFEFVSVPVSPRPTKSSEPPRPPSDVATNAPPSISSRLFVVVIDDLHILEQDLVHTKQILTDFINALSPDDEVAVVFVGHSNLSQNFTTDRNLLLKTLNNVRAALGFGLDALGQSMSSAVASTPGCYIHQMAVRSDLVLKGVTASLAGSSHPRRAVVYVTAGSILSTTPTPDPCADDFDDLQEVYALAHRADVPIYTIDPRGQVLPDEAVRGGIGNVGVLDQAPSASGSAGAGKRALIAHNIQKQNDRLAEVAVNTGGRAFTGQSNLTRAVKKIVADNGNYYLLGYYPSPFSADGKFHTFSVTVKRPGVRVRARQGYVASKVEPESGDAKPALDAAMSAGVNVSALSLRAFASPISTGAKGMNTLVTVEVTYPPRPDASRQIDDDLIMNVLALDPDAGVKASSGRMAHFNGTAPGPGPVTVLVNDVIDLPSQPLTIRIAVASRALGKAGSVQMSIEVPKPSDGKLHVSGVLIGVAGPAVPQPAEAGAIKELVPFQPTTSRVFSVGDTLRVFARAFWGSKDTATTATVTLTGPSTASPRSIALTGARDASGHSSATLDTTVPLAGLAPGKYVLEVSVKAASASVNARAIPIEIK